MKKLEEYPMEFREYKKKKDREQNKNDLIFTFLFLTLPIWIIPYALYRIVTTIKEQNAKMIENEYKEWKKNKR